MVWYQKWQLSQNHRVVVVGRVYWDCCVQPPCWRQGQLKQVAQDCVQLGLKYFLGLKLHSWPGQPLPSQPSFLNLLLSRVTCCSFSTCQPAPPHTFLQGCFVVSWPTVCTGTWGYSFPRCRTVRFTLLFFWTFLLVQFSSQLRSLCMTAHPWDLSPILPALYDLKIWWGCTLSHFPGHLWRS